MPKIKTVLIIDEDPTITRLYITKLEQAGYRVLTSAKGDKGFVVAKTKKVDLILLDPTMSNIAGTLIVELMRRDPKTSKIPMLILTNENSLREKLLSVGVEAFFHKPSVSPKEVITKVTQLIGVSFAKAPKKKIAGEPKRRRRAADVAVTPGNSSGLKVIPRVPKPVKVRVPRKPRAKSEPIDPLKFNLMMTEEPGVKTPQKIVPIKLIAGVHKILMIEDDIILGRLYQTKLREEGQIVTVAGSAEEGRELIKKSLPDLLLLDVHLPGMTGLELLESMSEQLAKVPVIVMTNDETSATVKKAQELKVRQYLIKSQVSPKQVLKIIGELLNPPSADAV